MIEPDRSAGGGPALLVVDLQDRLLRAIEGRDLCERVSLTRVTRKWLASEVGKWGWEKRELAFVGKGEGGRDGETMNECFLFTPSHHTIPS